MLNVGDLMKWCRDIDEKNKIWQHDVIEIEKVIKEQMYKEKRG